MCSQNINIGDGIGVYYLTLLCPLPPQFFFVPGALLACYKSVE